MERKNNIVKVVALCMPFLLASCATKKLATSTDGMKTAVAHSTTDAPQTGKTQNMTFVQRVSDNQVYTNNITGSMSFNIQSGSKDISVNGSLRMRKDEVIRIQLNAPFLGFEVGRLEFTPTYVLIMDRLHKEYIKADYTQVDFLKKQGITFYSLQALFWNQLLLPGVQKISETDLKKFDADLTVSGNQVPVTYKDGNMIYTWMADRTSARINQANVIYKSGQNGESKLNLQYSNFKSVGVKMFPATQVFTLITNATKQKKEVKFSIEMDEVKTDSKWEATTDVPSKYKQVSPEDVLGKIMNM